MRLTLRTLLAYLDGILEPKDAEDLGKKIEESDYATGLVHRVRDVMRRLRLGAPSLPERGPGLDPNTVAEYLDNTLPADRVTDFEKVCLDSDAHLAEVAASHQILTLVLGEPAEIDETTRQRVYEVKDVRSGAKPPPPPARSPEAAAPVVAPSLSLDLDDFSGRKARPKPTVPEYLREPRRRRRMVTAVVGTVAVVCVVLLVLGFSGQYEPGTWFGDILVSCGLVAPKEVASKDGQVADNVEGKDNGKTQKDNPTTEEHLTEAGKGPSTNGGAEAREKSATPKAAEGSATTAVAPPAGDGGNGAKPPQTAKAAANVGGGTTTQPKTLPPPIEPPAVASQPPKGVLPVEPAPKNGNDNDAGKPVAPLPPNAEPEPIGRLMPSEQVLLSNNPPNGWTRVGAKQTLIPQEVLALPTYRPEIGLTSGVTVEMIGGTRVELLGSSAKDISGIRVIFGRVVLMPLGKGGTRLRVEFGDHHGTITFVDAESIAALDVRHLHAPGTNPESESPRVTADLFATGGAISWEETVDGKAGTPLRLMPSQRVAFDGQVTGSPLASKLLPKWIADEGALKGPMSPREQLERSKASPAIAQALPTDQPARIKLLELVTSRPQWEVKWLSLRCLGYVGQFHDMTVALNDVAQKSHWPDYIDALRAAVDRDAETAAAVRTALEKQYPQQAAELYRMLWRYSDKQLEAGDDGKGGEDAKLVRALDDDLLAVRVLANANLKEITGKGEIYRPEYTAARRQQAIRYWRTRLEAKEIRLTKAEPRAPKGRPAVHEKVTVPAPEGGQ
jgi:hypothetical protein